MRVQSLLLSLTLLIVSCASPLNQTWDYIIVGSGASGIPLADRLSESGKSVLLIERGFASSGRWGGTQRPTWLEGTNLTRFDIPALYQFVWQNNTINDGVLCPDVSMPAGCLLGGGTAINAGQFYLPTARDWENMPLGWRSTDMQLAAQKASARLPWTETPSKDGISYLANGTQFAVDLLTDTGIQHPYRLVHANEELDTRDHVLSKAEFLFQNGERSAVMGTYLVTANERKNFKMVLNTTVTRVQRTGQHIEGVQVTPTYPGGLSGTIKLTPHTGRVILSAGVFGTSKVLLRSGIGPVDQLRIIRNSSDGPTMVDEKHWIDRPVGKELDDAPALYLAVSLSEPLEMYDWESLWDNPPKGNVEKYLSERAGPLAEIQPSLGPAFWNEVKGDDNRTRIIQWDANSGSYNGTGMILFASNLNHGHTSRGRLTIDTNLFVNVSTTPYFNDPGDHDFKALVSSATELLQVLNTISKGTIVYPPPGFSLEDYLRESIRTQPILTSNHWVGSTRMGSACSDPSAVVDTTTLVCGTDNLHVVDGGIIDGVPTANPQGTFIVAAERAAEIILRLDNAV